MNAATIFCTVQTFCLLLPFWFNFGKAIKVIGYEKSSSSTLRRKHNKNRTLNVSTKIRNKIRASFGDTKGVSCTPLALLLRYFHFITTEREVRQLNWSLKKKEKYLQNHPNLQITESLRYILKPRSQRHNSANESTFNKNA